MPTWAATRSGTRCLVTVEQDPSDGRCTVGRVPTTDTSSNATLDDRIGADSAPPSANGSSRPRTSSILADHPATDAVTVSHEAVVEGDDAERLWEAYRSNFEPLEELAILQHCFTRDEVLAELADPAITKIVGWEGSEPVGLGMVTNRLESVPQISPRFLRAKYPDHAEHDRIYFGILVAVSPEHRGMTLFNRIYMEMWNIPAKSGGVLVFDICDFNRMAFDTDSLVERIGSNFPNSEVGVLDRQTWYAAELPDAIPGT